MGDALILRHAHLPTAAGGASGLYALSLENGFISFVTPESQYTTSLIRAQELDLEGQTVLPGFCDSHLHLSHLTKRLIAVDCETDSLQSCLRNVQARVSEGPEQEWVIGFNWNHNVWQPAEYGTAQQLDAVSAGHPVVLYAKSLHASWANSKALELAGISAGTPDPPGGEILRSPNGTPTGILLENAMHLVDQILPETSSQQLANQMLKTQDYLFSLGITRVHDFDRFESLAALQILETKEQLKLTVIKNLPAERLEEVAKANLREELHSRKLRAGWIKGFADGALGPRSAAMLEPYEDSTGKGMLLLSETELYELGQRASRIGWPLAIHAIGDAANRMVLDAYTRLRAWEASQNLPHLPHRVEHVQCLDPQDTLRFKTLDIIASVQPIHATSDMFTAERCWGKRTAWSYAYASLARSGAAILLGSDAPVETPDPFIGLHAAVTRRRADGEPGMDGWHPSQRLSCAQALHGYTLADAQVCGLEKLGRIAPGHQADLIVLAQDPATLDPQLLWAVKPAMTFAAGERVFG